MKMRRFIAKEGKGILIMLAVALLFSSGLTAVASDIKPIGVPLSGNVSEDAYIGAVGGGYVDVEAEPVDEEIVAAAAEAVELRAAEM